MQSGRKILIITYYWPPCGGAGVQRWLKFAKYLPEYGWEPIVLTVDPEYAEYPVLDEDLHKDVADNLTVIKTKAPKTLFSLYKKLTGRLEIPYGGFSNEDKPGTRDKVIRFIRGNFFLPDPRRGWNKYAVKSIKKIIKKEEIKVILTTSPPHSTQLIGKKIKKETNITWIADIRDPWTDIYYTGKLYQTFWAAMINKKLEASVLRTADKILVTCNATRNLFQAKLQKEQARNKIITLTNGFDEEDFHIQNYKVPEKFIITYLGTFADNYNIDGLLNVIENMESDIDQSIIIRFIGGISASIVDKLNRYKNLISEFIPYMNHNEAIKALMESSALLLVIPAASKTQEMIPGKLFEYLAAKRPIIAIGPKKSDVADILEETNSGKIFENNDSPEIKEYLSELFENFREGKSTAQSTGIEKYSRKEITGNLVNLLNRLQ